MKRQLLLGCGHSREKRMGWPGRDWNREWEDLITLDNNPDCKPDIIFDLSCWDWNAPKLKENFFDEIHAYEILEHLGAQGDANSFFTTFFNLYRLLVPGGLVFATTPSRYSGWLWGDPGHTRAIIPESLSFLDQSNYAECGRTTRSDYRSIWKGDFKTLHSSDADKQTHAFILQAIKPARSVLSYTESLQKNNLENLK
jgi:hypothetical protein